MVIDGRTSDAAPARRVVILGASNVIRGIPMVIEAARAACGVPVDLMIACGHGRSYGQESQVLGRTLPGIVPCGIWRALEQRPRAPLAALLTDVGNDLLYGASVRQILGWVETCCERLANGCNRMVITELPLASLATLDEHRFRLMRSILFPRSTLTIHQALQGAEQLNDGLATAARRFDAHLVKPLRDWYGFDPIHIRATHYDPAWRMIVRGWCDADLATLPRMNWLEWLRLRRLRPEYRRVFGVEQRQPQPAAILPDGSWLSFY